MQTLHNYDFFIFSSNNDKIMVEAPWFPIFMACLFGVVILGIICICVYFLIKKVDQNYSFGYRTELTLSSSEIWEWANKRAMLIIIFSMIISFIVDITIIVCIFALDLHWFYCFIPAAFMVIILLIDVLILNIWTNFKWKKHKI